MQKNRVKTLIPMIAVLLLVTMIFTLMVACGGGSDDKDTPIQATTPTQTTTPVQTSTSAQTTTPAEITPTPVETTEPVATKTPAKLFLEVTSPEDETVITTGQIEVTGKTLPTAIVSVNGIFAKVKADGTFSYPMMLEVGPNDIQVVASTVGGDETGNVLVVIYIPK